MKLSDGDDVMRLRYGILVLVAMSVAALPARAQVALDWKLKEGDRFYLVSENTFNQVMELAGKEVGKEIKQEITQTAVLQFYVEKKSPEGNYTIKQTIDGLMVKGAGSAPVIDDKVKGASFTLTLNPKLEVVKLEGYNEFMKQLAGDDPAALKTIKSIVTEELLTKAATQAFAFLPTRQVKEGDEWGKDRSIKMPLGPIGALEATNLYKYAGKAKLNDKEYDKITFTSEIAYSFPKEDAGIAFRVVKGALKADNAKGTIYFDSALGRLVQYEMSMNLTGNLTLSINNVPLETKITKQEQTVKVTLYTENPISKPK
jgi:hypothetical protein